MGERSFIEIEPETYCCQVQKILRNPELESVEIIQPSEDDELLVSPSGSCSIIYQSSSRLQRMTQRSVSCCPVPSRGATNKPQDSDPASSSSCLIGGPTGIIITVKLSWICADQYQYEIPIQLLVFQCSVNLSQIGDQYSQQ